jgi:superfamily II DNA or RNA helicase
MESFNPYPLNIGMDKVIVREYNQVYMQVFSDAGIEAEIAEHFSFLVPNYQFHPKFKMHMWDGRLRLFDRRNNTLYAGLLNQLKDFCEQYDYQLIIQEEVDEEQPITKEFLTDFEKELKLPFELRDYQREAIFKAIQGNRQLLISPTGSGKSAVIYALTRFYGLKTLIIVPTTSLVSQMQSDFENYSQNDSTFDAQKDIHCIWGGQAKESDKNVVISTWQSLFRLPKSYFEQYDVVIGDEVHLFKAKSLVGIMEKLVNARFRFGTTGTLDGSLTNEMTLQGLFGPTYRVTTTKKLMDEGHLAELSIQCLLLKYDENTCKEQARKKYNEEIEFLISCKERNLFIRNLALTMKENTLVLFQRVDSHGKLLYRLIEKKIQEKGLNRKVFFIAGEVAKDVREQIRKVTETEQDAIIVASLGTFSTGVNIQNLENIIFASPTKSQVKVLQSIGRGLRVGRTGKARVYDICDDLTHKSYKNWAQKHFIERVKIYTTEKFKYKIHTIKISVDNSTNKKLPLKP